MFGRHFGRQFQRAWEEGWVPPWMREDGPGRHHHGPGGHHGHGPIPRFFGRGDMKFALLGLLQERPMYGYEMIKALEDRSGGFYSPSPGSIYPTLQMLEERGFVTSQGIEGKKVYSITDTGRALLDERPGGWGGESFGPPWMRGHHGRGDMGGGRRSFPEMMALRSEAGEVMRLFMIAARTSLQDPARLTRLRGILEAARKDLADMIFTSPEQSADRPAGEKPASETPPAAPPDVENV